MFDYSEVDKSVYIQKKYPISNQEYDILNKQYGKLCWFAATKLARSNRREEEDLQDFHSEIQIGMFRSGSYYKRQVFIDKTLRYLKAFIPHMNVTELDLYNSLRNKWSGKKNHFGEKEEAQLRQLFDVCKRLDKRVPDPEKPLFMGKRFNIYCKAIIWNTYKALGQHVSKENERRNKEISLDEWSFLEGGDVQNGHGEENISYHASFYDDSIGVIKTKIAQNYDSTTAQVFDIITNPDNHNRVFKKREGKRKGIKINIIRKETKMSYYSINKHLKKIKKVIEEEMQL
jgi:hypothetical protein